VTDSRKLMDTAKPFVAPSPTNAIAIRTLYDNSDYLTRLRVLADFPCEEKMQALMLLAERNLDLEARLLKSMRKHMGGENG